MRSVTLNISKTKQDTGFPKAIALKFSTYTPILAVICLYVTNVSQHVHINCYLVKIVTQAYVTSNPKHKFKTNFTANQHSDMNMLQQNMAIII